MSAPLRIDGDPINRERFNAQMPKPGAYPVPKPEDFTMSQPTQKECEHGVWPGVACGTCQRDRRIEDLEQAFRRYASHDDDCISNSFGLQRCDCGYREVLETLSEE